MADEPKQPDVGVTLPGVAGQDPAPGDATSPAPPQPVMPIVYQAGGIRKTFFAFVFLILLPFYASLPVMLWERLVKCVLLDTWGLIVLAAAFTLVMALVVFELLHSIRSRIEVGSTGFRYTLPKRGILPMLGYRSGEVAFADVEAVETRREIYGGSLAPVILRGVRIRTRDGKLHPLGYVSEADVDPVFPLVEIAETIAQRSGLTVQDAGSVWRQARHKIMGRKSERVAERVTAQDLATLNRKHHRFMLGLVAAMVMLLLAGIGFDFESGSIDRGERARDAIQRTPAETKAAPKR